MPITTVHPDYDKVCKRYALIRAIVNNEACHYIRTIDPDDPCRNRQYREDAILTNFTNFTKEGLSGLVFSKPPVIELPSEMEYLLEDATGTGVNIWQFSQSTVSEVLQLGRHALLPEFHNDTKKAYLKPYAAEAIDHWRVAMINGIVQPWMIKLVEYVDAPSDDPFNADKIKQYRVLLLQPINGEWVYTQEVWQETVDERDKIGSWKVIETSTPVDADGNTFDYIPLQFLGSVNNDWVVDFQPLYDISVLNVGHYKNSADYEESIFITGQPFLVINTGDVGSLDEFKQANPNGIKFGSRSYMTVGSGGDGKLLQANANQLVSQAMKEKLEQAAQIGARLIESAGGRETAEAAKIRYGSQHSALYTLTSNISWGIARALQTVCRFMGVSPESVKYKLNDQFFDEKADPNLIAQMWLGIDRGVLTAHEVREYGRRTGWIESDRTDEEMDKEVEQMDPLQGGAINDNAGSNTSSSNTLNASNPNASESNT